MTIYGVVVCRNEAGRYLRDCLEWNSKFLDDIFIYDDQSIDDSVEIARQYATVEVRPDDVPTFLDDEGAFRQAGWDAFEKTCHPQEGDFILAFDLDEFVLGESPRDVAERWNNYFTGAIITRPEVWDPEHQLVRTDQYWSEISNLRLWPWQPDGKFKVQPLAGGSHPLSAETRVVVCGDFHLLHYGYAHLDDRKERHGRYSVRGGHSVSHINSILHRPPTLKRYEGQWGPLPDIKRAT